MTTLADAMLEVARFVSITTDGTATGGSTSTLLDTNNLVEPGDFWSGGTLFLKTCAQTALSGSVVTIAQFSENKLTFSTLSKTITAGDTYSIAFREYSRLELKNAVLSVLRSRNAEMYNASLTAVSGATSYALPTGVKGIRRVIVDGDVSQHWHEINAELVFPSKFAPASGTIELIYCTPQGDIAETGTIDPSYDFDWLKWSAIINCIRSRMLKVGKDEPILMDDLKTAQMYEQQAKMTAKKLIPTDMRLA